MLLSCPRPKKIPLPTLIGEGGVMMLSCRRLRQVLVDGVIIQKKRNIRGKLRSLGRRHSCAVLVPSFSLLVSY